LLDTESVPLNVPAAVGAKTMEIHYTKHHAAYIMAANALLERLDTAHKNGTDFDVKATAHDLAWNLDGIYFHNLFWENLAPQAKTTEIPVQNHEVLIGIRPEFDGNSIAEGQRANFQVVALDASGKRVASEGWDQPGLPARPNTYTAEPIPDGLSV